MRGKGPKRRILLDSNVFVYARIADRKYGRACASIVRAIAEERLEAWASLLVLLEVSRALQKIGLSRRDVVSTVRGIQSLPLRLVPVDGKVLVLSMELFESSGISPYDCVHAATAILLGISTIVSADKDFEKIPNLVRADPIDFSEKL